jgi:hypothetical protein
MYEKHRFLPALGWPRCSLGIQGDAAWSDTSGTHPEQVNGGLTDQSKIDLLSSVTGRLGYAWDRTHGEARRQLAGLL